jgi:GTPase involved in cell partitioning and DNA repair
MNIIDKINNKKDLIISELYQWSETFNPENIIYNVNNIDEEDENEMFQSYYIVKNLAEKLEKNECDIKDYENIYFHIEQINYNKTIIKL